MAEDFITLVRSANSARSARCPWRLIAGGGSRGSSCPLLYRHGWSRYSTVHLVFDICQGIGVAAAVGVRPFLPALVDRARSRPGTSRSTSATRITLSCRAARSCLPWRSAWRLGCCSRPGWGRARPDPAEIVLGRDLACPGSAVLRRIARAGPLRGLAGADRRGRVCGGRDRRQPPAAATGAGAAGRRGGRSAAAAGGGRRGARGRAVGDRAAGRRDRRLACSSGSCWPAGAAIDQKYAGLRILR